MADRKKVLLANDDMVRDEISSKGFVRLFDRRNVDMVIVGSLKDALKELAAAKYDLIVTDMNLTGNSKAGLDLITKIRETDKSVKIFVSTGFGNEYKEEAMKAGANGYSAKPYDIQKLFWEPLGMGAAVTEGKAVEKQKSAEDKRLSLRRTIHEIGNKNNCTVMVSSVLKSEVDEYLKKEKLSAKAKELFARVIDDLNDIYQAGKEADDLLKKVRDAVYKQVDPDKVMVED